MWVGVFGVMWVEGWRGIFRLWRLKEVEEQRRRRDIIMEFNMVGWKLCLTLVKVE